MGARAAARVVSAALLALAVSAHAEPAAGEVRALAETVAVAPGQTLLDLARAHDLGYVELVAANPRVDPWLPAPGATILLPTTHLPPDAPHRGLVVNLADMRLYAWVDGVPASMPVGIGRDGFELSPASTRVTGKRVHPSWVPPPSVRAERPDLARVVPPGPDNPLGDYALDLGLPMVRIHGTNKPDGVGRRVSHGCLRLYPEDIARLFSKVAPGTPVAIVDQPAKLGRFGGELFLEVHPSPAQADQLAETHRLSPEPLPGIEDRVAATAAGDVNRVDWSVVAWVVETRMGVPVQVTR
ncbi:MAG: L,D-transpeptidase family protein [Actinomycetota bacterium]